MTIPWQSGYALEQINAIPFIVSPYTDRTYARVFNGNRAYDVDGSSANSFNQLIDTLANTNSSEWRQNSASFAIVQHIAKAEWPDDAAIKRLNEAMSTMSLFNTAFVEPGKWCCLTPAALMYMSGAIARGILNVKLPEDIGEAFLKCPEMSVEQYDMGADAAINIRNRYGLYDRYLTPYNIHVALNIPDVEKDRWLVAYMRNSSCLRIYALDGSAISTEENARSTARRMCDTNDYDGTSVNVSMTSGMSYDVRHKWFSVIADKTKSTAPAIAYLGKLVETCKSAGLVIDKLYELGGY